MSLDLSALGDRPVATPLDYEPAAKSASASPTVSLPEVHGSIPVAPPAGDEAQGVAVVSWLRRVFAFAGPGFLVAVGYMDPGNWGTDLAGGSKFGYALLWVILASNLIAMLLQTLCARMGIVTGLDLAQSCRAYYSKPTSWALWLLCEVAIIACDLAEVIGSAVALNLLFGIPLLYGVLITGADVLVLLLLMNFGFRKLEAVIVTLVGTVAACFLYTVVLARPDWSAAAHGTFLPSMPNLDALLIALGILGATVMPHNLYLHSSIVQTRRYGAGRLDKKQAIKFNTIDTIVALGLAFFVNAAILILAASVFHKQGIVVDELQQAHELLTPLLGGGAALAFAVALLASGQSSTITGTLAGQIVMEGFLRIRIRPWLRRLITRGLAIIPALLVISATGGKDTVQLLIVSQVVLSMQLPFAIFPLMMITSSKQRMGEFASPLWVTIAGFTACVVISGLNVFVLYNTIGLTWLGVVAAVGGAYTLFAWVIYPKLAPAA